ncbi:MAG: hypothetical protein IPI34_07685 [bacterium]|nr:hypothetical protein [bacterium]
MNTGVIRALVALHVRQVAADRASLFWLFGMPLMFTVLMGMMFGDMNTGPRGGAGTDGLRRVPGAGIGRPDRGPRRP